MQAAEMHDAGTWMPLVVIMVWVILAGLFTYVCFRKVMTDD
ncbi:hypothetical protein [Salibacterium sp. K-3]